VATDIELDADIPLMETAAEGYLDLIQYLLESGADVHAHNQILEEKSQESYTVFTIAYKNRHLAIASLLLQFGADLRHLFSTYVH